MNIASVLAAEAGNCLAANYTEIFGSVRPEFADILRTSARVVIERIANSDALYHDADHTILVTTVGQAILRGRLLAEHVTPEDWAHFTIATLLHDIGYLRGICPGDGEGRYQINDAGDTIALARGASDAALAPYHVDRAKIFIRDRLRQAQYIDPERVAHAVELTRFPVPDDDDHGATGDEPGLVRAADLIGQLGDPYYPTKWNALYYEFLETGVAEKLKYQSPADLAEHYPRFFWDCVSPYIQDAIAHLDRTEQGKRWLAQLYSHVFVEEHVRGRHGPERAHNEAPTAPDLGKPD